ITLEITGQAVSRNQATTGAITRSLMKSHAVLSTARITLNPALISSITSEITGHTHVWNHDTTACTAFWIPDQTVFTVSHSYLNAGPITLVRSRFSPSRTGKTTLFT